jgi:PilZ domain
VILLHFVPDHFRVHERRAEPLSGQITTEGGAVHPVRLLNLSLGGACVEVSTAPEVASRLRLELEAPNLWDPLHLIARVVWVEAHQNHFRVGLAFQFERPQVAGWVLDILSDSAYG